MPMFKRVEDDENLKKKQRDVIPDGSHVSVPMLMMDAASRNVFVDQILRREGITNFDASKHRPGYAQLSDGERSRRAKLYRDHEKVLTERWKNPASRVAHEDVVQSGDESLNAYEQYEKRLTNAWRHR